MNAFNRYIGLPPSWHTALSQVGFDEDEIAAIHSRRRAAVTGTASNPTTPVIPFPSSSTGLPTTSIPSSTILLEPVPRSTSLRKGRDALTIHPPSMYSIATSTGGGSTIGRTSPVPSARAPSFSMKSFVSGIKNSLTSDTASTREGIGGSGADEGATGEESEQYVFVNGDGPEEGENQGMGNETMIEPYHYDTASVSSHHTHTSSIRQPAQVMTLDSFVELNFVVYASLRDNRRHEYPPFHRSKYNVPNPLLGTSPSPMLHLRSPTPPPSPSLHPHMDTLTLTTPPLCRLPPLPVQDYGQDKHQHPRGHHPGEYITSRTRHRIPMMGRITLNHPLPMFRPRRKNGYRRKRKKALDWEAHLHPTDLFPRLQRKRMRASLPTRAITTIERRIEKYPRLTRQVPWLMASPGQSTRFWISRPITVITPSTKAMRRRIQQSGRYLRHRRW